MCRHTSPCAHMQVCTLMCRSELSSSKASVQQKAQIGDAQLRLHIEITWRSFWKILMHHLTPDQSEKSKVKGGICIYLTGLRNTWGRYLVQQLRLPLVIPASHTGVPRSESQLHALLQLPTNVHHGRLQTDDGSKSWVPATHVGVPGPGLGFAQSHCSRHLGSE